MERGFAAIIISGGILAGIVCGAALADNGGNVVVNSALTGKAITNAQVILSQQAFEITSCQRLKLDSEGAYRMPETKAGKQTELFVTAPGYYPAVRPVTGGTVRITMTRGRTVRVTGIVYGPDGTGLSGAWVSVAWAGEPEAEKAMEGVRACRTETGTDGSFVLEGVPVGEGRYCMKVVHGSYPVYQDYEHTFSTKMGDFYTEVTLADGSDVPGMVRYTSGEPVTGVLVWAEYVTIADEQSTTQELEKVTSPIPGAAAYTDRTGRFDIRQIPAGIRFLLKCVPEGRLGTFSGPWTEVTLGGKQITLEIPGRGGYFIVSARTQAGELVRGLTAQTIIQETTGGGARIVRRAVIPLKAISNGWQQSCELRPGVYQVDFAAENAEEKTQFITVGYGRARPIEISMFRTGVVTGRVIRAENGSSCAGAAIRPSKDIQSETGESFQADANGRFMIKLARPETWIFSHPGYAETMYEFKGTETDREIEIVMKKPGAVRVEALTAAGVTASNMYVVLAPEESGSRIKPRIAFTESGTYHFKDISPVTGRYCVSVLTRKNEAGGIKSDYFQVTAGEETNITVRMPEMSELAITFGAEKARHMARVMVMKVQRTNGRVTYQPAYTLRDFLRTGDTLLLRSSASGEYRVFAVDSSGRIVRTAAELEGGKRITLAFK